MGENSCYLHYEIVCDPVALRHIQMLKRAAASFVLSLFSLLIALQLVGSSELHKIWCWNHVICTHLVKCQLKWVRNALN